MSDVVWHRDEAELRQEADGRWSVRLFPQHWLSPGTPGRIDPPLFASEAEARAWVDAQLRKRDVGQA